MEIDLDPGSQFNDGLTGDDDQRLISGKGIRGKGAGEEEGLCYY
jgi:hypothetical protein